MMIDSTRLERSLIAVAQKYAPVLVPSTWRKPGDYPGALPELARALARENVLVMIGDTSMASIKAWTDGYISLYGLLTAALFQSLQRINAFYLDQQPPPIVALYGEATPVIRVFAGFVVPYVVARQGTVVSEVETNGMMDMILEELEATDLGREEYRRLRDSGAIALRHLLDSGVRQFPLAPAARPLFDQMAAQRSSPYAGTQDFARPASPPPGVSAYLAQNEPPIPPHSTPPFTVPIDEASLQQPTVQGGQRQVPPPPTDLPEPPPPPPDLPETLQPPPVKPEEPAKPHPKRKFDPDAVPIFFNPQRGGTDSPVPPVPPLPPRDKR